MKILWDEMGFKPAEFTLENEDSEVDDEVVIREKEGFTPAHNTRPQMNEDDKKNLSGVSVRNLPLEISGYQAQTFLETLGLPEAQSDITTTRMKYSTTLDVEGLTPDICSTIMNNIHETVTFDRKIYCKGIITTLDDINLDSESDSVENPENETSETNENNKNKDQPSLAESTSVSQLTPPAQQIENATPKTPNKDFSQVISAKIKKKS
jgi:hypothetical protein